MRAKLLLLNICLIMTDTLFAYNVNKNNVGKQIWKEKWCEYVVCHKRGCSDGSIPPTPSGACCPDLSLCPITYPSTSVQCFPKKCPDGRLAPTPPWWPEEECCAIGNVGGVSKTCRPGIDGPQAGSVCCPDAGRCRLPSHCDHVRCLIYHTCKDGSGAGYPLGSCCNDPSLCLDPKY